MALYQRGRIWYADFYDRGKRVPVGTGTSNRRRAEEFLALRISDIVRGVYTKPVKMTLHQLGEKYMEYAKANKRSWLRYEQILRHLNDALGRSC